MGNSEVLDLSATDKFVMVGALLKVLDKPDVVIIAIGCQHRTPNFWQKRAQKWV